ncbi:molybdopterin dinucleotide binding domain-containing protein [Streptomyces avermitilis]|uniref:Molybdopterin dinucleotide-binding domain-containing protein n=1 Tax=Streptomyces avermitilis TaxID=33903 RepID=A0A4D4M9P8_STRAX|nr:molybdopterin dinucleotide binding domain-containing protein [Streptomyces avermitilis]GDY68524.1 hypothetical protein SAV14893_079170 [Streptomyces avermitilis]GDY71099.1 hypothetical protein SAV31267_005840 [Streptomyces avermitilis]
MAQFPIVLAAGQRRAFTANTISRDSTWRRRDPNGTLRISPHEAERFGLAYGAAARITARRGTAQATVEIDDRAQAGHTALPNGPGLDRPARDGTTERVGVAVHTLTALHWSNSSSGTPWHKHVPDRIKPLPT